MPSAERTGDDVMIAGVGYPFLRDLSLGPVLVPRLRALDWPPEVEIDDWSFNPIAIVQRLEERSRPYSQIILLAAVERAHQPGQVTCYHWDGELPDAEVIQQSVGEAVMGVISLDNLLTICGHFGVFPPRVTVIEVEPEDTEWGDGLTDRIEMAVSTVVTTIRHAIKEANDG